MEPDTSETIDNAFSNHNNVLKPDDNQDGSVEMDLEESEEGEENNFPNGEQTKSNELQLDERYKEPIHEHNDDLNSNKNSKEPLTNIVQIINLSPSATLEHVSTLFGHLGDIVNIELYHSEQNSELQNFKVCFVEYAKSSSVALAQHLTNTVLIDRALIVLPYNKQPKIPDKDTALAQLTESDVLVNFNSGVVSQVTTGVGGIQYISTNDPRLTALGLTQYPQLPVNTEPTRLEEIRRTLYIGNLDSTIPPDQVLKFFNDIGEVKYIRMAGDDTQPTRFAFVEFTHQSSVANALQHNGLMLGSRALKINHSNNAIVKPPLKMEALDSASKRVIDSSREQRSRDDRRSHHTSSRYDRERDRIGDRDRDRYRRSSPRRRGRSRESSLTRRRSRSRDGRSSRRSRSREKSSRSSRRSRSRDSSRRRRRSRSRSSERSRSSRRHHKSSRR